MRQKTRSSAQSSRSSTKEPLAEGLQVAVPTDPKGRRLWRKMTDEQIVDYATKWIEENKITGRKDLSKSDHGLYGALQKRELLGEIRLKDKRGKRRFWADVSNEDVIEIARKVMERKKISGRKELEKADSGLCAILRQRGLLDEVGFETKLRSWESMSDEEIVKYTKKLMEEKGITGRKEMVKADSGLYSVLGKRGLLDEVGFEEKRRKKRSWKGVSNEEIIELARKVMKERGICGREELKNADLGLYDALRTNGLLDSVGFEEKQRKARPWKSMGDNEIVEYARKVIGKKEIYERSDLRKSDNGLYSVLQRRGLLDSAFAHIDQQKNDNARDAVIDALEAFAANDNASSEDDVA